MVSARPDSPGPEVSVTICFAGETMLTAKRAIASASQPKIAFLRWCALQRAMRAARFGRVADSAGSADRSCLGLPPGSSWMMRVFIALLSACGPTERLTRYGSAKGGRLAVRGSVFLPSGTQVEEHGEHPPRLAARRGQPEFPEDTGDILLHRPQGDDELVRDPLVGAAPCHQLEHVPLARREAGEGVVAAPPRQQRRHDDRVERRAAIGDAPDRRYELLDVADPVLQQVTGAFGGLGQELHRQPELDVLREHEHTDGGMLHPDPERGPHPLVLVRRR